jgi:hypothetical protein
MHAAIAVALMMGHFAAALAVAQTPATSPLASPTQAAPAQAGQMPAAIVLAQRLAKAHTASRVLPHVVVVRDAQSYLDAIAAWTPVMRFPVLIDDGSAEAAEEIGRFVRGFGPQSVTHWKSPASEQSSVTFSTVSEQQLVTTLARSWDIGDDATQQKMIDLWRSADAAPPGVVAMDVADPAWTAGLALAAGRGQPMIFVKSGGAINGSFSVEEADGLARQIEDGVQALGLHWNALGDEIDAVALTIACPARIDRAVPAKPAEREFIATTDRIGRLGSGTQQMERWAWASQIFGSSRTANYQAMCGMFLSPRSAWLFDGYRNDGAFGSYDLTKAGDALRAARMSVEVIDWPDGGAAEWRARAARPVQAQVLMVNTMGNSDFFELSPGRCLPADLPLLDQPAAVHFIHSWSALFPGNATQLLGRWFERGIFFYYGSVHEPFLSAFLTPEKVAARINVGAPWAAALRYDNGEPWKLACFGDPLFTSANSLVRGVEPLPLENAIAVDASLREDLKADNYEAASRALVLAGRDSDLTRLAGPLLRDKADKLTPAAAELLVLPLFRQQRAEEMVHAFSLLDKPRMNKLALQDALWHMAYPRLGSASERLVSLLRINTRADSVGRDTAWAALAISQRDGKASADAFLASAREKMTVEQVKQLNEATRGPIDSWGR